MEIFTKKIALEAYLSTFRESNSRIGFVATMGALHKGHIQLIETSKKETDLTVCSIFVNPTQFNDPADLEKYPRPIEQDIQLLQQANCEVLFLPEVEEMYAPNEPTWHMDLGRLDEIWEGAHRPGHYQGVTQIVKKLFDIVKPNLAFFGQKDLQQCLVIQQMVKRFAIPVTLKIVETVRDEDGLAKSSRNTRLSPNGRTQALALSQVLFQTKANFEQGDTPAILKQKALDFLHHAPGVELEYFAICNPNNLEEVNTDNPITGSLVAILAAWVEGVRLIDNILLNRGLVEL